MRLDNIVIVAKREYLQRIRSKGFWIATLILPLFVAAATILPTLLLSKSRTEQRIVVVDTTGRVAPRLHEKRPEDGNHEARDQMARFEFLVEPPAKDRQAQRADLDRRVLAKEIGAWIWIDEDVLAGKPVEYHAKTVSNVVTQEVLSDDLSYVVRRVRFADAGLDPDRVGSLSASVKLETVRISKEGSRAEGGMAGAAFAYILFLLLYMVLVIWGQQVMQGVLEEKSSRIIEVVISSVKPFELLMGKLTGICLVGLTQFGIWMFTLATVSAPGVMASIAALPKDTKLPTITPVMALHFLLLFILGFFVFSTLYAAIGAAFNNLQEAQQVAGVVVFFLVIPVFLMIRIINDPSSTFAVVASLIPLFTPLLMTLRISLEMPPLWQILLAYALTLGFLIGMVWVCARIYRIGILMYGKKPTFQELWKWIRYA
ncbi:MAG TPA: ABC transporter permease [Thermoanaerobaculia bacterium]|nr:ABC transporter permease [Thermoanaerobaculia bacterium]